MGVARPIPSMTLETALQFQMNVLRYYHVIENHIELLSLDIISGNIFELFSTISQ